MGLAMAVPSIYRRPPRGRPQLGFELEAPEQVVIEDGVVLHCREVQQGREIGALEIRVFAAALIIDRDGLLAKAACDELARHAKASDAVAVPVQLPGTCGYVAQAILPRDATRGGENAPACPPQERREGPLWIDRSALPYVHVFAMAPPDGIDGGVLVTVRSARPEWPAADHMLASLRLLTRHGVAAANDDAPVLAALGVIPPAR